MIPRYLVLSRIQFEKKCRELRQNGSDESEKDEKETWRKVKIETHVICVPIYICIFPLDSIYESERLSIATTCVSFRVSNGLSTELIIKYVEKHYAFSILTRKLTFIIAVKPVKTVCLSIN